MKVLINLKPLRSGSKTRGVGVYTRELLASLKKNYKDDQFIPTAKDHHNNQASVVHFPYFDPFFRTLPVTQDIPTVVTVHDLIPLKFPNHFPRGIRGSINLFFQKRALKKVNHIITDSKSSKNDIIKILSIPKEQISVVPLASSLPSLKPTQSQTQKTKKKYNLPEKYILYVGDINWNKNVLGLIKEYSNSSTNASLVLVGKAIATKSSIPEKMAIDDAIKNSSKKDKIHIIGYTSTEDHSAIYGLATLYVQPSFYEGFGLPILEAMQLSCPVLSSDRGSLKEVAGDAAEYFNPHKRGALAKSIDAILANSKLRGKLTKKGLNQVKKFTWTKAAQATYDVYRQVIQS